MYLNLIIIFKSCIINLFQKNSFLLSVRLHRWFKMIPALEKSLSTGAELGKSSRRASVDNCVLFLMPKIRWVVHSLVLGDQSKSAAQ